MGVGGQRHAPATLPPEKTRYPLYRRLGGPKGRSGRVRKISPPTGFDPRTIQSVASRYTDYTVPTHAFGVPGSNFSRGNEILLFVAFLSPFGENARNTSDLATNSTFHITL